MLTDWHTLAASVGALNTGEAFGMLAYMQRTTIKLSDDLDSRLRHEAQRQGVTISEVSRTAIEMYLGSPKRRKFLAAGAGASGHGSIAEQIEDIIRNEVPQSR